MTTLPLYTANNKHNAVCQHLHVIYYLILTRLLSDMCFEKPSLQKLILTHLCVKIAVRDQRAYEFFFYFK